MKIETRELADREIELTVEIPEDRLQAAMSSAARRLSRDTKIPGFRPGKAPYDVVLRRFGEEAIFEEALENLGQQAYREALDQAEIEPYAPGTLDEMVTKEPLVLRYTVPLAPEIDLGNYREMRAPYEVPEVKDEAVDQMMEELRQSQALVEPVERPAQMTDVVILEVRGELQDSQEDENPILVDEQSVAVLVSQDTDWPFTGVVEHLEGMEAGQERDVTFTFPEDYPNESLRGRSASFHLSCLEVKSRFLPEWTDDLAKNLGDFEGLLDLRINVRKRLEEQASRQAEAEYARGVVDAVVESATVRHPPLLLEDELDTMVGELSRRLQSQNLNLEDYLKIEGKTEEDLREEMKPQAQQRLARALVLGEVVRSENLELSDEELQTETERLLTPFGENADELRKTFEHPVGQRHIALDLLTNKAIKQLVAINRGEADNTEGGSAELVEDPESDENSPQEQE